MLTDVVFGPWLWVAVWGTFVAYTLAGVFDLIRLERAIERIFVALMLVVLALILNEAFFGFTAKDVLNNRLLYPVYEWYRFG